MKKIFLRNAIMTFTLLAGLSLTSCKDKAETTTETETVETTEGTSESPMDTVVTENDTVIETGTPNDAKENPVGTQVP